RIESGEKFDVVIASPSMLDGFARAGILGGERVSVGRVGQGIFVRQGTAVPDVSTPDALKRAVLDADSLVFNRATGGMYIESLLRKMGVYDQIEKKITRYVGGTEVFDHVAKGRGKELGFGALTQIAEYRAKGLQLAGALPGELQNYNPYAAATMRTASNAGAAQSFVRYLGSPAAKTLFAEAGID
ncbi:MAG TPA: substrate-binding domain-containing protein, partial [Aestuariivirgaceae bacterium]|nr:substrate-binding domain-containing protein [Aestuariivirgaceae bacterium]